MAMLATIDKLFISLQDDPMAAKKVDLKILRAFLRAADAAYYLNGKARITDEAYDVVITIYRKRRKIEKKPFDVGVGLPKVTGSKNQRVLPFPVGRTLKFIVGEDGLQKKFDKWTSKYATGPVVVSHKLDGCSGVYSNTDGVHMFQTREGFDISYVLPLLNLPQLPINTGVRGEIIMETDVFEMKWGKGTRADITNARGAVAGQLHAKASLNSELVSDFRFVVFEFINAHSNLQTFKSSEGLRIAASLGFWVVDHEVWEAERLTLDNLQKKLINSRLSTDFDIDGLVISMNSAVIDRADVNSIGIPRYVMAFKENAAGVMVTIDAVEWRITRTKRIIPRVTFESVWLGSNVSAASAHNAKFVEVNGIGPGATVRVAKSGDVIPKIMSVVKRAHPSFPDTETWKWDKTRTHILSTTIGGTDVLIDQLYYFIKKIGVKYVAAKFVETLVENHVVSSIVQLLNLKKVLPFAGTISGIGTKKEELLRTGMENALRSASFSTFVASTQLLGMSIGVRKLRKLLDAHKIAEVIESGVVTPSWIKSHKGFGKVLSVQIADKWETSFLPFWDEVPTQVKNYLAKTELRNGEKEEEGKKEEEEEEGKSGEKRKRGTLSNEHVLLTGFRDSEISDVLGDSEISGWRKNITMLVIKDAGVRNKKVEKAEASGIPVVTSDEFRARFMG